MVLPNTERWSTPSNWPRWWTKKTIFFPDISNYSHVLISTVCNESKHVISSFQSWPSFFWEPSEQWGWGEGVVLVSSCLSCIWRDQGLNFIKPTGRYVGGRLCLMVLLFFISSTSTCCVIFWNQLLGTSFGQRCWSIDGQLKGLQCCSLCSLSWQQAEPRVGQFFFLFFSFLSFPLTWSQLIHV